MQRGLLVLYAVCPKRERRAAAIAGFGLSVKAALVRRSVFCQTVWAHLKGAHSGLFAVIGQRLEDAIAGPTVGAASKRITIAPINRIENVLQTLRASD